VRSSRPEKYRRAITAKLTGKVKAAADRSQNGNKIEMKAREESDLVGQITVKENAVITSNWIVWMGPYNEQTNNDSAF